MKNNIEWNRNNTEYGWDQNNNNNGWKQENKNISFNNHPRDSYDSSQQTNGGWNKFQSDWQVNAPNTHIRYDNPWKTI